MIRLSLGEIAALVDGRTSGGADASAVVTGDVVVDSRQVHDGALFVCLRGEHVDGHDFARAAVDAGAVAVIAQHEVDAPAVIVADPQAALGALAHGVLARTATRVVGVTGSSGKTSTKDLLAAVFGAVGDTVAAVGSFNNEIGLPLTVLRAEDTTQTLVLEYSARGIGHIRYLCGIARPDISLVLNVGAAHLGEFGSREAIATAKGELVEALAPEGVAVLNADDDLVRAMAARTTARVMTFGEASESDVRIESLHTDDLARPQFTLRTPDGAASVKLQLAGAHHAANAAAVVAAAIAAGVSLDVAIAALERVSALSPHRMQLRERRDGVVVIDDAYNANPESMRAALRALSTVATRRGRSWAVLGAMRELGDDSPAMHEHLGVVAAELGIDEVIAVGTDAAAVASAAAGVEEWPGHARCVADVGAAVEVLRAQVRPGDVVLVKASNSEQLWRVADGLVAADDLEVAT